MMGDQKTDKTKDLSAKYVKDWREKYILNSKKASAESRVSENTSSKPEDDEAKNLVIISSENIMIDIRQLRQHISNNSRMTFDLSHWNNALTNIQQMNESRPKNKLYIIVDTNILLGELSLIRNIKRDYINTCPEASFLFVIPYVVLQELDLIKYGKHKRPHLTRLAEAAVSFLHEAFLLRDIQVVGETTPKSKTESSDESIIRCCVQYKETHKSDVIILSNDFYLSNKAIENSIEVCSSAHISLYLATYLPLPKTKAKSEVKLDTDNKSEVEFKRIFAEWNSMLLILLADILQYEMKAIYGNEWSDKVFEKPPWTLRTLLAGIKQHWEAVFLNLVSKDETFGLNKLINKLPYITDSLNAQEIEVVLNASQSLIMLFKPEIKHYQQIVEVLNKIDEFKKHLRSTQRTELSSGGSNTDSDDLPTVLNPSSKMCSMEVEKPEFLEHLGLDFKSQALTARNDMEIMKHAFAKTWNFINYNCGLIIDSLNSSKPGNPITYKQPSFIPSENDTCLFLRRFYPALTKLKFHLKRVLEMADKKPITEKMEDLSHLELCNMLESFASSLELESENILTEIVTPDMLIKFVQNLNTRNLIIRGLEQLNHFIKLMYEQKSLQCNLVNEGNNVN